jgi:carboxyl-terminal processing protease
LKRFTNTSKKLSLIAIAAALIYIVLVSPWPGNLKSPGGLESQAQTNNLNITHVVMQYVKRYYVNQENIDPKAMLIEGLGTLERIHDQILVNFPNGEESTSFEVQVVEEKASFDMSQVEDLDSVTQTLEEVFGFITPRISDKEPEIKDVEYAVLDQMLKSLDQHSGIIPPEVYKEFMIETEGSFGGLGIVIGIRDGELTVISPIEGTPAYRVGIKPNDKIVQIEHESTVNMSLIEAVSKLRGRKGTDVTIYIDRETFPKPKEFSITRDTIKIESVETFELDDGIRYVRIRDFQKNTLDSIIESLNNSPNNPSGMIVDLRGNPGGLLDQAERISDLFLASGVIVTTKVGNSAKRYHANDKDRQYEGKVVVLVDSGSASASEILAGALKNNERAVVIGQRTFGKGSVQQIFDMTDGSALKLTIAQYLTPGDISIQDVGVTPDIVLHPVIITEDTVVFDTTPPKKRNGGKDKTNTEKQELEQPIYSIRYLVNNTSQNEDEEPTPEEALSREERLEKLKNDFYISLAKDILLSSNSPTRKDSLRNIQKDIGQITKDQEDKIVDKWRIMGVDWSSYKTNPEGSSVSVNVLPPEPTGNAGEELQITVEVENTGSEPLYRLHASTSSENAVFAGKEFIFGKIAPGEKKSWTTTVELPKWSLTRQDDITLEFEDANDSKIGDHTFNAGIQGLPRPLYGFNYEVVDDGRLNSSGNSNGFAETGEMVTLKLRVKNIGAGASEKTVLSLKNESGENIFLDKGRVEYEKLEPGETRESVFSFHILKPSNLIEMELQIVDEVFREGITSKVLIPGKIKDSEFIPEESVVTVPQVNTPIRGGSYPEAPIIALSEKDAVFKTVGTNGNWIKIKLDEKLLGWINKDKVRHVENPNGNMELKPSYIETFETPPIISISNPPLSTNTGTVTLSGSVNDNDGIELISVFVGDDKVALLPSSQTTVPVSLELKLDEEVNLITIIAKDTKGLLSKQSFVVRKEG